MQYGRTDPFFLGSHILSLYLKIDENSVPDFLVKTFASVTWALCSCSYRGSLSGFLAPDSRPQAQGLSLSSRLPGVCKLQALHRPCGSHELGSLVGRRAWVCAIRTQASSYSVSHRSTDLSVPEQPDTQTCMGLVSSLNVRHKFKY